MKLFSILTDGLHTGPCRTLVFFKVTSWVTLAEPG